jgi:cytochrome c-type biogenesis protein CcmH
VAKRAAPDDVVYIFARAVQGPRMPLAIVSKQVKDLPATVVLDDSSGMMSDMKLSSAAQVIVIARVSKTGNPSAQAGDLEGKSAAIKPGTQALDLSIAEVLTGK